MPISEQDWKPAEGEDLAGRLVELKELLQDSPAEFTARFGRSRKQWYQWKAAEQLPPPSVIIAASRQHNWPLAVFETNGPRPSILFNRPGKGQKRGKRGRVAEDTVRPGQGDLEPSTVQLRGTVRAHPRLLGATLQDSRAAAEADAVRIAGEIALFRIGGRAEVPAEEVREFLGAVVDAVAGRPVRLAPLEDPGTGNSA